MVNFGKDLRTLTANAKEYNRKGSPIHKDATTLEVRTRHAHSHAHTQRTGLYWTVPANISCRIFLAPLFFSLVVYVLCLCFSVCLLTKRMEGLIYLRIMREHW